MKESKYWEVRFIFHYPNNPEEDIRVTGNTDSLGNWNTEIAPKLIYDSTKEYWKTKTYIKIPALFNLEYKYVIFKNNEYEKMEEIEENRKVSLPGKKKFVFSDEQNNPKTTVTTIIDNKKRGVVTSAKNVKMGKIPSPIKSGKQGSKKKIKEFNLKEKDDDDESEEKKDKDEENLEESTDNYEELNYDSFEEEADELKNTKMSATEVIKNVEISDDDEIILCSTYIPFNPVREKDGTFKFDLTNEAIYHTLYRVIESKKNIKWFGNLKYLKKLSKEDRKEITTKLEEKNVFVFDIEESIYHKVLRLSEEILEPLFHYNPLKSSIMEDFTLISDYWKAYKEYNDCVCKQISKYITKKTLIYLNDIQFLLVPNLLYSLNKHNNDIIQNLAIGIFIHSPFPSFDVFKRIPIREDIIKSLMKCRVIGFHTFDCNLQKDYYQQITSLQTQEI